MKLLATIADSLGPGLGRIAAVDLERETAEIVLEWVPPPSLRASGKGFLGLAWLGIPGQSDLVACGHAALCRIDPVSWTVTGVLHQPCMNDLHHVAVHDGRLLVTNTGLDRVEVFETSGQFVGGWDLSPAFIAAHRLRGCNPSRGGWERAWRSETRTTFSGRGATWPASAQGTSMTSETGSFSSRAIVRDHSALVKSSRRDR